MGAYTCEYGVVHKMCRCPTPHTVKCNVPWKHKPSIGPTTRVCMVWEMKKAGVIPMGKHEAHLPHDWWATSSGGGHQMDTAPEPNDVDYNKSTKWHCPGG